MYQPVDDTDDPTGDASTEAIERSAPTTVPSAGEVPGDLSIASDVFEGPHHTATAIRGN